MDVHTELVESHDAVVDVDDTAVVGGKWDVEGYYVKERRQF